MSVQLEVLDDKEAVARRAAEILTAATGHIALSGGSTPKRAYALAAQARSDWRGVTFWLGDERHVPPADPDSNARMIREELLTRLPRATLPAFEPVDTSLDPEGAAADYGRRLRDALGEHGALDLALMGLGPDSHTASLFPGKPAVEERHHRAVAVPEAGMEPQVPRITLTLPVFNAAREVVFLVAGEDKAQAMQRAFGDPPDETSPAALVRPKSGALRVLCDPGAARLLA
jgi:6-phosphogluconolactonase